MLSDSVIARRRSIGPAYTGKSFLTSMNVWSSCWRITFRDTNTVSGWMPFCSAAASTNGLNAEPGCRCPSVAMLNVDSPFLRLRPYFEPPTIAFTSPSRGSIETSEPEIGVPAWPTPRSRSRTAFSACACSFRSIDV